MLMEWLLVILIGIEIGLGLTMIVATVMLLRNMFK